MLSQSQHAVRCAGAGHPLMSAAQVCPGYAYLAGDRAPRARYARRGRARGRIGPCLPAARRCHAAENALPTARSGKPKHSRCALDLAAGTISAVTKLTPCVSLASYARSRNSTRSRPCPTGRRGSGRRNSACGRWSRAAISVWAGFIGAGKDAFAPTLLTAAAMFGDGHAALAEQAETRLRWSAGYCNSADEVGTRSPACARSFGELKCRS